MRKFLLWIVTLLSICCFAFGMIACKNGASQSGSTSTDSSQSQSGGTSSDTGSGTSSETSSGTSGESSGDTGNEDPGDPDDTHQHVYGDWTVTKDATCQETGLRIRSCSCGDVDEEVIPLADHTPLVLPEQSPTCDKPGLSEGLKCSVCGTILTPQTEIGPTGHTWVDDHCDVCGTERFTEGLEFVLSDSNEYTLAGIGEATDRDIIVPKIYREVDVTAIAAGAFANCGEIESVYVPASVKTIGAGAFENCENLKTVKIMGSITAIGDRMFSGCAKLQSVTIPDSVLTIGVEILKNCSAVVEINVPFVGASRTDSRILGYFFGISDHKQHDKTIPSTLKTVKFSYGELVNYMFYNCKSLTSVKYPETITSIPYGAFNNCTNLADELFLPSGLKAIETDAFNNCTKITGDIIIPESVKTIGMRAFNGCSSLNGKLVIPDNFTTIINSSFAGCSKLTEVSFGKKVTNIGDYAFSFCTSLKKVNYGGALEDWMKINFGYVDSNPLYYAHKLYINDDIVSGELVIPESVTKIPQYCFYNCTEITSLVIHDKLNRIDNKAFAGCTNLKSAEFKDAEGWKAGSTALTLSDKATAADYLTTTYTGSTWNKIKT